MMSWTDLPHMQIGYVLLPCFNGSTDLRNERAMSRDGIHQHCTRGSKQAPGPTRYDDATYNAHGGIQKGPAIPLSEKKRSYSENRRQRIRNYVEVSGA